MPVPDPKTFARILDAAQAGNYALASINVTSTNTANAALAAFAESKSDGIIQISTGGAEHLSGPTKDMALGAISLAEHVHRLAERLDVYVALTTDHCVPEKLDKFVRPIIAEEKKRHAAGQRTLFNGFMFDGSELPMNKNLDTAYELLSEIAPLGIILEVEVGLVGGEEDGIDREGISNDKLYTTPEDMVEAYEKLHKLGRFTLAATFGNVHGVYKPGNVKLKPSILKDGQDAVKAKFGKDVNLDLVFHGGSGSLLEEIHQTLEFGVVKMNIDTDCQYAFTRPIVDHLFSNYSGALRIDGEMGNKKVYDPRSYLKKAEAGMKDRIIEACTDLKNVGKTLFGK